ncbi:hypothetical protein D3C87_780610 [compost metagenome]
MIAPEVQAVDAVGVELQGLLEQLLGLVAVAETDGPAGHAVIQRGEAGVGRALQGFGVEGQGFFQIGLGVLGFAQCAESALGTGPTAGDDAFPDPRFGHRRALRGERVGFAGQLFERGGALFFRHFILDVRPALLDALETLLVGRFQRPDTLTQGGEQQACG